MSWGKCNVVMLPTEKAKEGNIGLHGANNSLQIMQRKWLGNKFFDTEDSSPAHGLIIPQHLYITSDEEIKGGDWFIELDLYNTRSSYSNKIYKCDIGNSGTFILTKNINFPFPENCRKIIATTNTSLKIINLSDLGDNWKDIPFPSLLQQFINYYIEEYNKGNIITEVLVEYVEKIHNLHSGSNAQWVESVLKVDVNNFINIKPIKDSWSKEEVIVILHKFVDKYTSHDWYDVYDKWLEENL